MMHGQKNIKQDGYFTEPKCHWIQI